MSAPHDPVILAPDGRTPAADLVPRRDPPGMCPGTLPNGRACRALKARRGPANGFGIKRPVCRDCGHVFEDEVWDD